ncbi:nucleoside-diphosphate-sugar epimerase [Rubricella aquisinus]|uniref:Nucleoside-diphosphate-sugar epimerase n=1 Tax=Rubricella aquisinus TaxID=2028108 RepID=A0A840X4X2_9RHOB|nr:D-erythronate dehydrogenase [Rubricella aquisinus]MBB5516885.1 nucleoside-diphosphate-sugar epimerase [Rubricella aquisinus]
MRVLITGAQGFLGRLIVGRLVATGSISGQSITAMTLIDMVEPTPPDAPFPVTCHAGDLMAASLEPHDAVIHLAAVVSAEAEADLDKGLAVNLDATRRLLMAARDWGTVPIFLFASSVAVFAAQSNERLTDRTEPTPRSSYGAQKLIGEILVRDLSRKGIIRGRSLRFPTIAIRPGKPNKAASSFASSIIREPLNGEEAILPVSPDLRLHLMSPDGAVAAMAHALDLPQDALDGATTITLPGISVAVSDMLAALTPDQRALVKEVPDAAIAKVVESWPGGIDTPRAEALGFTADADFAELLTLSKAHL